MQDANLELMEKAPVPQAILKLSIPTILSTIVSLLYNLADTFFIGMLDDPIQLGAISLAFPAFMVLQAVGNIVGSGAPSYISRCLGAKNYDEAKKTSCVSVYLVTGIAFFMGLLYFIFQAPVLRLLGTSSDTIVPTQSYLRIIMAFGFVLALQVILPSLLRAEGKITEAVSGMVIGTVANIILDPIFILGLHQGVAGAAWATVIGNMFAVIYYLRIFLKGKTVCSIQPKFFQPSKRIIFQVLKIGLPASIAQIIMSFSNILMNNLAADYGDYVISAYGVAGKITSMVFMITVGYVSGYMPFAGYNYGAGKIKRMVSALKFTMLTATGVCLVLLIPLLGLAPTIMRAFTSDAQIIETGIRFLHAQAISVPLLGVQMTMMSTFQATGRAIPALVVNLGRQCLFYIPLLYLLNSYIQLSGLMYAQPIADFLTTGTAVLIGVPMLSKLLKLQRDVQTESP